MVDNATNNEPKVDHEAITRRQSVIRSGSLDITQNLDPGTTTAERNLLLRTSPLYKIVLTGGPCGGKTTALARLSSYLSERGFQVFTIPEAYTILASNGFSPDYFSVGGMPECVQTSVMDLQISLEDAMERVARARGKPAVLLCDRGLMDGGAYMDAEAWEAFLRKRGITAAEIREGRYNAVFHLVTAAEGAEEYYTLENNAVRTETVEEAREVDSRTRGVWVGHPKHIVFGNEGVDFEGKLQRLVEATAQMVGLPTDLRRVTTKFLLTRVPDFRSFPKSVKYHIFDVEKVYLYETDIDGKADGGLSSEYSFIRKRTHLSSDGKDLGSTYGLTTVTVSSSNQQQIEVKRIITAREYRSAYKTRDVNRHIVKQTRISFLHNMQSFNVHIYREPANVKDLCILHAQVEAPKGDVHVEDMSKSYSEHVIVPEFLDVGRKLNSSREDQEQYGAYSISLIRD